MIYHNYLPLITSNRTAIGAQVWGGASLLPEGAIALVPVYLNDSDHRHEQIVPVLGPDTPLVLGFSHAPAAWQACECECCPPEAEHYADYAQAVSEIVRHYQDGGYHVLAVAIEREPDSDRPPACTSGGHYVNCWGMDSAAGKAYGELIDAVHRALPPGVELWAGELYLHDLEFARGMAGAPFDCLSFHTYIHNGDFDMLLRRAGWLATVTDAPLCLTETSVFDDGVNGHEAQKAAYMRYLIEHSARFQAVTWFTLANNGWPEGAPTDLCYDGACYEAYDILTEFLKGSGL